MMAPRWLRLLYAYRQTLWIVLTPLLLLPIPCALPGTVSACGYCILLMAIYWITEALPLAVTAFIPVIIFPLTGIMDSGAVSASYFKDTTFLVIGGLMIAVGVEITGLHKRIALKVLLTVGPKPHALLFGFMFPTFFLSMWITNTATTALMLPIVEAVFNEMKSTDKITSGKVTQRMSKPVLMGRWKRKRTRSPLIQRESDDVTIRQGSKETAMTTFNNNSASKNDDGEYEQVETPTSDMTKQDIESQDGAEEVDEEEAKRLAKLDRFVKGITISVPYSASIGGTVTLTGTGSNMVLHGQFQTLFPDADISLSFANWFAYNAVGASVFLLLAYIWLCFFSLGFDFSFTSCCRDRGDRSESERRVHNIIKRQYEQLGEMRWGEATVLIVFITTVLLWFFREPGFIDGYALIFPVPDYPGDGTVAMLMATLLFMLPGERPMFLRKREDSDNEDGGAEEELWKPVESVLVWSTVQNKFPWNIPFLIAGGFALADGSKESGFSEWMGEQLTFLGGIEPWAISLTVTIIVCLFTECSTNSATASLFVPILAELARKVRVHPLYLMMPPVLASSLAFMLPVATPPNAIAFSYGHLKVIDLVKAGWLMNVMGIGVICLFINTYGMAFWNLDSFPEWAEYPNTTTTT